MYKSKEIAFEAMVKMAEHTETISVLGEHSPAVLLDSETWYKVENLGDIYRVEVEVEGVNCIAERVGDTVKLLKGSDEMFREACMEFNLAM